MKKLVLFLMLLPLLVSAQTYNGIGNFPKMTVFAVNDNSGVFYYVVLSEDDDLINKEGKVELAKNENGKVDSRDIEALTVDSTGTIWLINNKSRSRLHKIDGADLDGDEGTNLTTTFVGNTGLKSKSELTSLQFIHGKLYGIGHEDKKLYQINTSTGEATEIRTITNEKKFVVDGLTLLQGTVYFTKTGSSKSETELWKFDSFPNGSISKVMKIEDSEKVEAVTAHPNGFIYVADDEHWYKVDPVNQTTEKVVDFESDIEGMDFFYFGEAGNSEDANITDLSLTSSVDNAKPDNGENITFTVTITNNGSIDATNVVVNNTLPEGIDYVSSSATIGSAIMDEAVVWTIPTLPKGATEKLETIGKVNIDEANQVAFDLGTAKDYNVFVIRDADSLSSDTEGRMAVGRNAVLGGAYSVGYTLENSNGSDDVLIVGRNLQYGPSGAIYGGNVVVRKDTTWLNFNPLTDILHGSYIRGTRINFGKAAKQLRTLSSKLSKYKANGITELKWSSLRLNGRDPFLNVFTVTKDDLDNSTEMFINAPNGSVVLVNFTGRWRDTLNLSGNLQVYGTDMTNVLYNVPRMKYVRIEKIDVTGTLLAPRSNVNFVSGVQNGQMIAYNLTGDGQFNNKPFIGNLPIDSSFVNIAEIISADQADTNSTPGNGDQSEDDYAEVQVTVDQRGSGTNSGQTVFDWEFVSNFNSDELVWTLYPESKKSFLAGTWGGKIYRTDNAESWVLLNGGQMDSVDYIWSILEADNGNILAGTERGVYVSEDNGTNWSETNLPNVDVRALAKRGAVVYAGTWGDGLYKSTDNGKTWAKVSNDLSTGAIVGLILNGKGDLFIGTFDMGIYKSTDEGAILTKLDMEYPYIWTLSRSSNGNIYAGTYGNGLYSSVDNGKTWGKEFDVTAHYIYSVTTKKSAIYASSWSNGVFTGTITAKSASWQSMGLAGYGISSILPGPKDEDSYVYAGTSEGEIYRANTVTAVDDESTSPLKYSLSQNYPNPFNPSTVINFTLPEADFVTIKVFNIIGQVVKTLVNTEMPSGEHKLNWNGTDDFGNQVSSGAYIYQIKSGDFVKTRKMVLLR